MKALDQKVDLKVNIVNGEWAVYDSGKRESFLKGKGFIQWETKWCLYNSNVPNVADYLERHGVPYYLSIPSMTELPYFSLPVSAIAKVDWV